MGAQSFHPGYKSKVSTAELELLFVSPLPAAACGLFHSLLSFKSSRQKLEPGNWLPACSLLRLPARRLPTGPHSLLGQCFFSALGLFPFPVRLDQGWGWEKVGPVSWEMLGGKEQLPVLWVQLRTGL